MTALLDFQRAIAPAVMQPLTARDTMPRKTTRRPVMPRGPVSSSRERAAAEAIALVKPNSRLSSVERLEIYSRSYWSRVRDALGEDFPGVRAVVGAKRWEKLRNAYLDDCPSESFTMRDLGRRLPAWIEQHPDFAGANHDIALDMARLEWAHIESFDAADDERLSPAEIAAIAPGSTLGLQPHLRWIEASSEVDTLLIEVRHAVERAGNRRALHAARGVSSQAIPPPAVSISKQRIGRARAAASDAPLYLAIHRHELVVHYKRIDREMFRLLDTLARPLPLGEALVAAGKIRVRPILMTTFATLFGLLPLALGLGSGAELQKPLALAVIGGLLLSTFLTLLLMPVLYSFLERGGTLSSDGT